MVWVRKSIQRRSAGERVRAERRDAEVMLMVASSSWILISLHNCIYGSWFSAHIYENVTVAVFLLQKEGICGPDNV